MSKSRGTSRQEIPQGHIAREIEVAIEQLENVREELISSPIIARHEVRGAEVVVRRHAERQISELLSDREGALGESGRIRRVPGLSGMFALYAAIHPSRR